MALAQIIQGTSDELIAYLNKHTSKNNLTLIIPEEPVSTSTANTYPEGAVVCNGVPLFPTEGRTRVVTPELVQRLLDEEE